MGVIHKLKREVVDFIIAYKTKEPDISCRRLVDIVRKKFDVKVSKSSINTIFKSANLSSPVGRRGVSTQKTKKFQIPEEKLKELFPQEKRDLLKEETSSIDAPQMSKNSSMDKRIQEESKQIEKPEMSIQITEKETRRYMNNLGAMFLKAAICELTENAFLSRLLDNCYKGDSEEIKKKADYLLFNELFIASQAISANTKDIEDLMYLNGIKGDQDLDQVIKIKEQTDINKLKLAMSIELPQLFKEVNSVAIVLDNGQKFIFDGSFSTIWSDYPPAGLASPLFSVVSRVTAEIIENVQSCFLSFINDNNVSQFGQLCKSFEKNAKYRLDKIIIYNQYKEEIVDFKYISNKDRFLYCAVLPDQNIFKTITKVSKQSTGSAVFYLNKPYYYRESMVPLNSFMFIDSAQMIKVGFISESPDQEAIMAILTNDVEGAPGPEGSFREFLMYSLPALGGFKEYVCHGGSTASPYIEALSRKQNFYEKVNSLKYDVTHFLADNYSFDEILQVFLDQLNIFCQYRYFPVACTSFSRDDMVKHFYSLSGEMAENRDCIKVIFSKNNMLPERREDLIFAAQRVNEQKVSINGKKLFLVV